MWNIEDLANEAETLRETIARFSFEAGLIDSRLALNLWYLQRSMQAVLDQIEDVLYQQD